MKNQFHKHQPYRRNDGFWSCGICRWKFETRPSKDNCPGVLRIECATDEYKTEKQWRKLGFEVVVPEGKVFPVVDAVSIVHSTVWYLYYHRDHVRRLTPLALDEGYSADLPGDSTPEDLSGLGAGSTPALRQ